MVDSQRKTDNSLTDLMQFHNDSYTVSEKENSCYSMNREHLCELLETSTGNSKTTNTSLYKSKCSKYPGNFNVLQLNLFPNTNIMEEECLCEENRDTVSNEQSDSQVLNCRCTEEQAEQLINISKKRKHKVSCNKICTIIPQSHYEGTFYVCTSQNENRVPLQKLYRLKRLVRHKRNGNGSSTTATPTTSRNTTTITTTSTNVTSSAAVSSSPNTTTAQTNTSSVPTTPTTKNNSSTTASLPSSTASNSTSSAAPATTTTTTTTTVTNTTNTTTSHSAVSSSNTSATSLSTTQNNTTTSTGKNSSTTMPTFSSTSLSHLTTTNTSSPNFTTTSAGFLNSTTQPLNVTTSIVSASTSLPVGIILLIVYLFAIGGAFIIYYSKKRCDSKTLQR